VQRDQVLFRIVAGLVDALSGPNVLLVLVASWRLVFITCPSGLVLVR
jgi:hypothetical protein